MTLPIADSIVEWDLLLQVVWAALAAGVGITIAASCSIVGAARVADARRDGDLLDTLIYGALFLAGLVVCLAAVVFGIVVMTSKG